MHDMSVNTMFSSSTSNLKSFFENAIVRLEKDISVIENKFFDNKMSDVCKI